MQSLVAEWETQSGVLLAWPHAQTDWRELLPEIEICYAQLAAAIARFEHVLICVADEALQRHVRQRLLEQGADLNRVVTVVLSYNDTWTRDYGPLCIASDKGPQLLDLQFNGWGGRYPADLDNQVTNKLHGLGLFGNCPVTTIPWVLEGGAIDCDGQGTVLTTERCLTHARRNQGPGRTHVEKQLRELLGVHTVLWLTDGELTGDDTDGHVDQLARFCAPDTIAYSADDANDAQGRSLRAMARQLQSFRQPNGAPYRLVPLPVPGTILNNTGDRLPASYVNYLIINNAILVPCYDDPADRQALQTLSACFPEREIVPIPARSLLEQGGSIHCATMQLPAGVLSPAKGTIGP